MKNYFIYPGYDVIRGGEKKPLKKRRERI